MKTYALAAALVMAGMPAIAQDAAAPSTAMPAQAAASTDPAGGYQPATPPLSGQPQAGQPVVFQPAKSPAEAYPAPAAMQEYPVCKKGQYDNCRQRGG